VALAWFTLVWIVLQGAFGAWTVTLKLKPLVVTAHLLGGMVLFGLLLAQSVRVAGHPPIDPRARRFTGWAALALGETVLIRATPEWRWHFAGGMRLTGAVLILVHLACTTAFRMRILWDHLHQQDLVRGALARTSWRLEAESPLLPWLLVHGWVTGLAANLAAVMPWAALLCVREQSLLLLPLALVADVLCTGLLRGVRSVIESINEAFYRNHWLEHHSRLHFVYLHGMHHDALPFGAIAVGEEGVLGELVRRVFAVERNAFMSHLSLFQSSTLETLKAMVWHQYIPGIFPYTRVNVMIENHHIEHHFLRMKPLAFGSNTHARECSGLGPSP
jgi:hypothetical protein